jgi:hypothetical protein
MIFLFYCVSSCPDLIAREATGIVHFSGHGQDSALALEAPQIGLSDSLSVDELKNALTRVGVAGPNSSFSNRVALVFVSACHSEKSGQAFVDAGVRHVIAVQSDHRIKDDSARNFTVEFYRSLFAGDTVRHAFNSALLAMDSDDRTQADKLKLLPADDSLHNEPLFRDGFHLDDGNLQTDRMPPCHVPRANGFSIMSRQREMTALMNLMRSDKRMVAMHGAPRIGKSSLLQACAHYLLPRLPDHCCVWVPCAPQDCGVKLTTPAQLARYVASCCESALSLSDRAFRVQITDDGQAVQQLSRALQQFDHEHLQQIWILLDGVDQLPMETCLRPVITSVLGLTHHIRVRCPFESLFLFDFAFSRNFTFV